jgi:hypothetical protein
MGPMGGEDRRRAERHPVDLLAELVLQEGQRIPVRVVNIGPLGALLTTSDLEDAVLEGQRVWLRHAEIVDGVPGEKVVMTPGSVVRVDLEFAETGVSRQMAIFFDGGAAA